MQKNSRKNINITIENRRMQKNHSIFDKTSVCESENDQIQNFPSFVNSSLGSNETEEIIKQEETTSSMEKFCESYYKDYIEKTSQIFTIKELTQKYVVKNRRVYELIGILEGFSLVCKLKKVGTYMWMGMEKQGCSFHFQENKSVALKNVAGLLKLILTKCRHGLTIKQLNQKIIRQIQQKTKLQQCKRTINRRIYECLKVMKKFGIVQKENHNFKINSCRGTNTSQQSLNLTTSARMAQVNEIVAKRQTGKNCLSK